MVDQYLDALEDALDTAVERDLLAQWHSFWDGSCTDEIFSPARQAGTPADIDWPPVSVNAAQSDPDAMVLQQYGACHNTIRGGGGHVLNVRANYGVGIMPLFFGAELFLMDEEQNCLPNVWPIGEDRVLAALDAGVPDLDGEWGSKLFATGARFAEIAATYPRIGEFVHIYHPDMQGPMDILELLWGSEIFFALVDRPELIHQCLDLVCETYLAVMTRWWEVAPPRADGFSAHWGLLHRGTICIRDDSAMNLSPEMFNEYIAPCNEALLKDLGGGMDHFCGRGDHFIANLSAIEGLHAVNLSQPHLNAMSVIFEHTVARNIRVLALGREAAEQALAAGIDLCGNVHCA